MKSAINFLLFLCALCVLSPERVAAADSEFDKSMEAYLQSDENVQKIAGALERYFRKKQAEDQERQAQAAKDEMEKQFANPVKVDVGSSPVRGNPNAPITIIEFSDFQCPFCARGAATMDEIAKEYGDKVKIAFKHLPLPFHEQATPAAKASIAAHKQGKFWEMHDLLFKNQQELGTEAYEKFAKELGLNMEKFRKDMNSEETAKAVEADAALAASLDVRGTPGFFVNGVQVKGARPVGDFKKIIDRWLAKK